MAAQVDRLRAFLAERGLDRNTLLVFFGDHGEDLGEHGLPTGVHRHEEGHGCLLFDVAMHVPLIFVGPGVKSGRRIDEQVSLVDVCPTVLDCFDIKAPYKLDGLTLAPSLHGEPISSRMVWMETHFPEELEATPALPPLRGVRIDDGRSKMKIVWTSSGE